MPVVKKSCDAGGGRRLAAQRHPGARLPPPMLLSLGYDTEEAFGLAGEWSRRNVTKVLVLWPVVGISLFIIFPEVLNANHKGVGWSDLIMSCVVAAVKMELIRNKAREFLD